MNRPEEVKAVIFDMDGVLVDSVRTWYLVFVETLAEYGKTAVDYQDFKTSIMGESTEKDIELFFPGATPETINKAYERNLAKFYNNLKPFPDSKEVLTQLKKRQIKTAVATNSARDVTESILNASMMRPLIDAIVCGDDVPKGKPDPAMLNKALKELGIPPHQAVFIGDTDVDAAAGKQAGIYTIGLKTMADEEIESLSDVLAII
ncbi:Phosphoglycolate phosphatase [uncultured archaeon]|nr:Phosphoglycolate phosphatase [uncultured archaeon]